MKNVQKLIIMALFLAIGTIANAIIPGVLMRPDFLLTTMFLSLFLFADKKNIIILGLVAGILSGLVTTFPNGFLPNVIDKLITSSVIFLIYATLGRLKSSVVSTAVLTALGTMLSGSIFLTSAMFIVGLPGHMTFTALFIGVVLPATLVNTVAMVILYPIVSKIARRTRLDVNTTKISA